jgi:hypothetical protein
VQNALFSAIQSDQILGFLTVVLLLLLLLLMLLSIPGSHLVSVRHFAAEKLRLRICD